MSMDVEIRNVSGIKQGRATLELGVNAVRASNWQGKTSLLDALQVAMGTKTPLTEGETSGFVRTVTEDGERKVTLEQQGQSVAREGKVFLSEEYDRVRAELFAFLDESNPVRQAVRNGENLEPLLTRPLDFENIEDRIAELAAEREQVERELERAEEAAEALPGLIEDIETHRADLESVTEQLERIEATDEGSVESKREELSEAQAERDRLTNRIERLNGAIDRIETTLSDKREEVDSMTVPDETDLKAELEEERAALSAVERDLELLQSVYEANERVLAENRVGLLGDVEHDVMTDSIECWVCGSATQRDAFEARLDALRGQIEDRQTEAAERRETVSELEDRREELADKRRRKRDLEREITDLEQQFSERRESLTTAESNLESVTERIADLQADVEATDDERTDLESRRKYLKRELDDLEDQRSTLEARAEKREMLAEERKNLTSEIESLRERKETVKREFRDRFDETIDEVVDRFETGFESARLTGTFDLVVAREGREASLDALSEGERELLGIVVALAGYLTFDVADAAPLLLLDGIGGLANQNLQALVEFLEPYPDYLVLTAYPEHGDFDGHEIDPTEWSVVSRELA